MHGLFRGKETQVLRLRVRPPQKQRRKKQADAPLRMTNPRGMAINARYKCMPEGVLHPSWRRGDRRRANVKARSRPAAFSTPGLRSPIFSPTLWRRRARGYPPGGSQASSTHEIHPAADARDGCRVCGVSAPPGRWSLRLVKYRRGRFRRRG